MKDFSVGIDIEELDRFKTQNFEKYAQKFLSLQEQEVFKNLSNDKKKQRYIASRFSVKESLFKALGVGIGVIKFSDISILNNELGKPYIIMDNYDIDISISYTSTLVTTIVILKKA